MPSPSADTLAAADARPASTIERIDVIGNRRLTTDAFVFASGLKVGDRYAPENLKRAFKRLWEKDLFDDLKVLAEDGDKGKIVIFHVKERPILVSVDYDNVKAITKSNIEDAFKQRNLDVSVGKPVNQKNLWKGAEYIKDLLASKGYLDSTVSYKLVKISETSQAVTFSIRQGPRTRIKKIEFVSNQVFSDRKLKKALKQTRQSNLFTRIAGKDLWRPGLYDQDVQKIFEMYRADGYLDVEIKPPIVEVKEPDKAKSEAEAKKRADRDAREAQKIAAREARKKKRPPRPGALPPVVKEPKVRRWVYLTVKVQEGPQYKTGEMKVTGNTVFTEQEILDRIPLIPGMVLNDSALQFGLDRLRSEYGAKGYIYATATKNVARKENNVADVTIEINEDQAYRVDRIEFEGNTVTRDSVLRREMRLNEGELLNRPRLDLSGYKIQQLGFVRPDPDPFIEPVEGTDLARIRINLEEQGRNEMQVGGGYSGLEGFFFSGSYSTRNFLGRGEILSAFIQVGGRSDRYQLSFREPWFLGKPYQLGFSVFRRDTQFAQNQSRTGNGGSIVVGRQIGNFSEAQLLYQYEKVDFTDRTSTALSSNLSESSTTIGSLTPAFTYDRVDNPFRPTRGSIFSLSAQIAGRAFGGDNSFYKPQVQYTRYVPAFRKTFFGIHVEAGFVGPYGSGTLTGGQILDVPRFERFFVGGDLVGPRIFETRSISPITYVTTDGAEITTRKRDIVRYQGRDVFGHKIQVFCDLRYDLTPGDGLCNDLARDRVGGNRYFLTQLEYAIPLANPFILAFFVDAGNAYAENQTLDFDELRVSTGLEARIYLPVFQAPIRFILGKAVKTQTGDQTNSFQFSIGTSF